MNKLIGKIAAGIAIAAVLFFAGAGWQKGQTTKAQVQEAKSALIEYQRSVEKALKESQEKDKQVIAELQQQAAQQDEIKSLALARLQSQLNKEKQKNGNGSRGQPGTASFALQGDCDGGTGFRLDLGTVRLLDSASANLPAADAAARADEAGSASSDVGIEKLVEHNLEVTKLYQELAKRHDGLVEWLENKQKEQQ
jgi:hypothetical protein